MSESVKPGYQVTIVGDGNMNVGAASLLYSPRLHADHVVRLRRSPKLVVDVAVSELKVPQVEGSGVRASRLVPNF